MISGPIPSPGRVTIVGMAAQRSYAIDAPAPGLTLRAVDAQRFDGLSVSVCSGGAGVFGRQVR